MTIDLVRERAQRSNLAVDWTPELALEKTLADIRSGKLTAERLVICLGTVDPDGNSLVTTRIAGTKNGFEAIGILTQSANDVMNAD